MTSLFTVQAISQPGRERLWLFIGLLATGLLGLLSAQPAGAQDEVALQAYQAVYQAKIKGLNVKMHRSLDLVDQEVQIRMKARKLIFAIDENSQMKLDADGRLRADGYQHKRRNLGDRHNRDLVFDWQAATVSDRLRPEQAALAIEFPVYDKLSYQEQLRLDVAAHPEQQRFEYRIVDGRSTRIYAFVREGEELIETPLGKLNTVKFKRDRGPDSERQTYIWFAKDWDYLLARLDQLEGKDSKAERLQLRSATIGGAEVKGL